jgi:hypothetical protein
MVTLVVGDTAEALSLVWLSRPEAGARIAPIPFPQAARRPTRAKRTADSWRHSAMSSTRRPSLRTSMLHSPLCHQGAGVRIPGRRVSAHILRRPEVETGASWYPRKEGAWRCSSWSLPRAARVWLSWVGRYVGSATGLCVEMRLCGSYSGQVPVAGTPAKTWEILWTTLQAQPRPSRNLRGSGHIASESYPTWAR